MASNSKENKRGGRKLLSSTDIQLQLGLTNMEVEESVRAEELLLAISNGNESDLEFLSDEDEILTEVDGKNLNYDPLESSGSEYDPEESRNVPCENDSGDSEYESSKPSTSRTTKCVAAGGKPKKLVKSKKAKKPDFGWKKDSFMPVIPDFEGEYILLEPFELKTPMQFFKNYISDELIDEIVLQTNIYSTQKGAGMPIIVTNKKEMEAFFGMHIMMGCLSFPQIKLYWRQSCRIPLIADAMPRDTFLKLRSNVHLVNNLEHEEDGDRFWKVRPIVSAVRKRCKELWIEENCSVDEQMIPFKGTLGIKQYIKGKPNPWGIKLFVLAGQSGIVYDFIEYQGSTTKYDEGIQEQYGIGGGTVMQLAKRIPDNKSHKLFCDNFFTTIAIIKDLLERGIYLTGTVRMNRTHCTILKSDAEMKKNIRGTSDIVVSEKNDVCLVKWLDKNVVNLSSSAFGVGEQDKAQRYQKSTRSFIEVDRPIIVRKYNSSMGGVDKIDHLLSLYRIFIKSRKWTLRVITHFLDIATCNSWLEYRRDATALGIAPKKLLDLLSFRLELAEALIKANSETVKRVGRPRSIENIPPEAKKKRKSNATPVVDVRFDCMAHWPSPEDQKDALRCKLENCKGKSRVKCLKCNVFLCMTKDRNCFLKFHTK